MGNYPYPSSYITNGHGELPAFPVRVACSHLDSDYLSDEDLLEGGCRGAVGLSKSSERLIPGVGWSLVDREFMDDATWLRIGNGRSNGTPPRVRLTAPLQTPFLQSPITRADPPDAVHLRALCLEFRAPR
jgi:hypothetical protein